MTGPEHYRMAETLLTEGRAVVAEIREVPARIDADTPMRRQAIRDRRDDLGKQAMGIWAQAQVHATLAQAAATALAAMTAPAFYPQPVTQFGDDTHTVDALNDWHAVITIAVPAAPDRQGGDETPSGTTDGGDTVNSRQRANQ